MTRSTTKAKEATIDVLIAARIIPCRKVAYSKAVTARALGLHRCTVYEWIQKGRLKVNEEGHVLYESLRDKASAKEYA